MIEPTETPASYAPYAQGRYDVKPGLHRFGVDFGNGEADRRAFQIDGDYHHYIQAKRAGKGGYLAHKLHDTIQVAVVDVIASRLTSEYPAWFDRTDDVLNCSLIGQTVDLQSPGALSDLGYQFQEDFAVMCGDLLAALHVCIPSRWSPKKKIGQSFAEVHRDVPGMAAIIEREQVYVDQMVGATAGLVRFVFGIQTDDRLDNFPDRKAPRFDPQNPAAFVRVERQVILGLPAVGASLFLIRPYLTDVRALSPNDRLALADAIDSMSPEALTYKGLAGWSDQLTAWLRSL